MCDCNQAKACVGYPEVTSSTLGSTQLRKVDDVGEIQGKINELRDALTGLHEMISRLTDRLSPVLIIKHEAPEAKGLNASSPSMTAVGRDLQSLIDGVVEARRRVQELLNDTAI